MTRRSTCAADGCENVVVPNERGRPQIYCSPACRPSSRATYDQSRLVVELDHEPTHDDARPSGRIWQVRLRRGSRSVTIAEGLGRPSAEHLGRRIDELLSTRRTGGGAID